MRAFDRLIAEGSSVDHHMVEIDGKFHKPTREVILEANYSGALIRIGKHLYRDRKGLTVGAPDWAKLFPTN